MDTTTITAGDLRDVRDVSLADLGTIARAGMLGHGQNESNAATVPVAAFTSSI